MRPTDVDTDRRPFVLVWEVTQACDLACDHCRADAHPERHPLELSTAEGRALLDEATRSPATRSARTSPTATTGRFPVRPTRGRIR
jgi:hypothetical protein